MKRRNNRWTRDEMVLLHTMRQSGSTFPEIAKKIGNNRTIDQCTKKYRNTHWGAFFEGNEKEIIKTGHRPWSDKEKKQLYDLKTKTDLTYAAIGQKLGRSRGSIATIYTTTDWKKFLKSYKGQSESAITTEIIEESYADNLVKALIEISRHDIKRLKEITKAQFLEKIIIPSKTLPVTFTELKRRAVYELEQIGYCYPSSKVLGKGTYIIVGDTHGKHTRTGMFDMLKVLSKHVKATNIIHVGHYIDDDNDTNYNWDKFDNLCIISKEEELKFLAKKNLSHDIVRRDIVLGDTLSIQNQDLITDYVQTALKSGISQEYFEASTICNLHRHEFNTRCTEEGKFSYVASPGSLCEKHIVYTIKQQDFTDGRTVKQTFPTGYKKYRRMKHMYKTWQQGLIVVEVDADGEAHIHMCRIHKTSKGFTTSYFDKIITEKKVINPSEKSLVISDLHVDMHDEHALDIAEQIAKAYKPDILVNLGDMNENKSINHHEFKKMGCMHSPRNTLKEAAAANYILTRTNEWADDMILLKGNHERFFEDYTDKFPQFIDILNYKFINGISDLDIDVVELKQMIKRSNSTYVHGDLLMFGQKGNKLDKIFRTYGRNTISGHCHYPSCRFDCYTVGLLGKLDLEYNEVNASTWIHSVITNNTFEDKAFISNILIIGNKAKIGKRTFKSKNPENWLIPDFRAKIQFDFTE